MKKYFSSDNLYTCLFRLPATPLEYERRSPSLKINYKHLGFGGQRGLRPEVNLGLNCYVDLYEPRLLIVATLIMLLSVSDAFFTLQLIARGAIELNLFMQLLLVSNTFDFIFYKVLLTALSTLFLVIHHNFLVLGLFKTEKILYALLFAYSALTLWEVFLLNHFSY